MKAYLVEDQADYDGRGTIVFADRPSQAKKLAMSDLDCCEWTSLTARRAPEFDGFEDGGDELIRQQLAMGWWFGCHGPRCERQVRDDGEYEEDKSTSGYVIRNGDVYCSSACCIAELRRKKWIAVHETWARQEAERICPGVVVSLVYENVAGESILSMRVPGYGPVTSTLDWLAEYVDEQRRSA